MVTYTHMRTARPTSLVRPLAIMMKPTGDRQSRRHERRTHMKWTFKVVVVKSEEDEFETVYNSALEQFDYSATVLVVVREDDGKVIRLYPTISCDGNVYLYDGMRWMALQLDEDAGDASSLLNFVIDEIPEKAPEKIVHKQLVDYWLEVGLGYPDPRIPEYARRIMHRYIKRPDKKF